MARLRSTVKNPQADICDRLFKFLIKTWRKKVLFSLSTSLYLLVVLVFRWCSFVLKSCNHIINVVCEPDERSNGMFHWRFLQSRYFPFMTCFTPSVNFFKDRMKCFIECFERAYNLYLELALVNKNILENSAIMIKAEPVAGRTPSWKQEEWNLITRKLFIPHSSKK